MVQKKAFIDLVTRFASLEEENTKLKEQHQQQQQQSDSPSIYLFLYLIFSFLSPSLLFSNIYFFSLQMVQKKAFIDLVTRFASLEEENTKLKEQHQQQQQQSDSPSFFILSSLLSFYLPHSSFLIFTFFLSDGTKESLHRPGDPIRFSRGGEHETEGAAPATATTIRLGQFHRFALI
jgi:hypothetical protein